MKIVHILILIPGILIFLLVAGGVYPRTRNLSRWVRACCLILALLIVGWGALSYRLKFDRASFSETEYWRANRIEYWLGGMILGIFITLLISGEFLKMRKTPPPRNLDQKTTDEDKKRAEQNCSERRAPARHEHNE